MQTAMLEPRDAIWATLELQLRSGMSQVLLGQKTAKEALDGVASDWQRSLRRAGWDDEQAPLPPTPPARGGEES